MVRMGSHAETSQIEREMAEHIAAAGISLRFDKSVRRLVNGLKDALAEIVPPGQALIFTVTAPIRRRAKTALALEKLVRGGLAGDNVQCMIEENLVRLRWVKQVPASMPKVVGFVHNPDSEAGLVLALAEWRLRQGSP
jgi:hypothetical protein